jgi:hypothetical protein
MSDLTIFIMFLSDERNFNLKELQDSYILYSYRACTV